MATSKAALLVYYGLDETSGNVANDSAPAGGAQNATAAVATSDWQTSSGIIGGAARFSPTGQADVDEAFIYNSGSAIVSDVPFTLSLWVNSAGSKIYNRSAIYFGDASFDKYYNAGTLANSTNAVQSARNTTVVSTISTVNVSNSQWHQVTAVFSANNLRLLYVDGQLTQTSSISVPSLSLTRIGLGALTRSTQTDAWDGMLDEVGVFDTSKTPAEIALLNAFPRYDGVRLNSASYDAALTVFNSQTGSVTTGTYQWSYATGLTGALGTTALGVNGRPYIVMDGSGNGLVAVPEPGAAMLLLGFLAVPFRRRK